MKLAEGDLTSEVEGEVVSRDKVLVIRRIRVTYHLKLGEEGRELAERVHGIHAGFCPVARTLADCVEIDTGLEIVS